MGGAVNVGTIVVDRIGAAGVLVSAELVEAEMDGEGEEGTADAAGTVMGQNEEQGVGGDVNVDKIEAADVL